MSERNILLREAKKLCAGATRNELKLSRIMATLYECSDTFAEDCEMLGIGYRKGMYLVHVYDRIASRKFVPEKELIAIGWTKLSCLTKAINTYTTHAVALKWLNKAKTCTVAELKAAIDGRTDKLRNAVFRLSVPEAARLEKVLVLFGMQVVGGAKCRYEDRAAAFMRMVKAAEKAV